MENISKTVAVSKKPTAQAVIESLTQAADLGVQSAMSDDTAALNLNAYFPGFKWYDVKNAKDSTDPVEKELWTKFQNPYYKALRASYKQRKGKELTNASTYWGRIKSAGKAFAEGTRVVGQRTDKTPEERLLVVAHPRWAEFARMEAQTKRQAEIQDLLSQLILKIGHDPQKVDLVKLGLKKS